MFINKFLKIKWKFFKLNANMFVSLEELIYQLNVLLIFWRAEIIQTDGYVKIKVICSLFKT